MIEDTILNSNFSDLLEGSPIPGKIRTRIFNAVRVLLNGKSLTEISVLDVVRIDPWTFANSRNVGHNSMTSLENFLREYGLHLGMTDAQIFKVTVKDTDATMQTIERTILAIEKLFPCIRMSELDRIRVKSMVCEEAGRAAADVARPEADAPGTVARPDGEASGTVAAPGTVAGTVLEFD